MSIDTNPEQPAFPSGDGPYGGGPNHAYGMTLRDWFAGQCFASALFDAESYTQAAARAYEMADAMLKARGV